MANPDPRHAVPDWCTRCLQQGHRAHACKHPVWGHARWADDHTPRINPVVAGQWAASLLFCIVCLCLFGWAVSAFFTAIKGA